MRNRFIMIVAALITMALIALTVLVTGTKIPGFNYGNGAFGDPLFPSMAPFPTNEFVETAIAGTATAIVKTPSPTAYDIFTVIVVSVTAKAPTLTPIPPQRMQF